MENRGEVTGEESEYEMLYCVHDMLSLYCRHHELIYGNVPERIGRILGETEEKMRVLESRMA